MSMYDVFQTVFCVCVYTLTAVNNVSILVIYDVFRHNDLIALRVSTLFAKRACIHQYQAEYSLET